MNIVFIFVAFFLGVIACVLGLVFASASSDADDLLSESLYVERVVSRLNEETLPEGMGTYPVRTMTINQIVERKDDLLMSADDIKELARNERTKAIDEFAEALRLKCIEDTYNDVHLSQVFKIAEQMKGGAE